MNFQTRVMAEYRAKGYIVLRLIRLNNNGYPDLQCLKAGKSTFIEVKAIGDILSVLQKFRIDELIKNKFKAFCLHETDGVIYPVKYKQK